MVDSIANEKDLTVVYWLRRPWLTWIMQEGQWLLL
jgi:hypothetical protein